ncbi:MAG: recombinase family protein [Sphingobium sp.]|nr:recombinase family protein [Sphingobium sp.]
MKPVKCAVYTRKSTEDGLEQEFNSLDAQREACEAYVASQRHEGWILVPTRYDDGGFSGGNIERPGLKSLLSDVEAGLVDVIVVYKVDRLTRSLADFAKIVERLDAREASFVSVTQAFNTTTSMGRLTLNVLLSFAQFEREVTGERIRDKIAASKKKGLWMGGPVPLGYQVVERKLVVVPEEAERVRHIMRRYIESSSVNALVEQLERDGVRTKIQHRVSGPHRGGIPFRRGSLFWLLKNPVYRGMIVHKGTCHPGEHEAIVDEQLWDAVQARLALKAPPRIRPTNDHQDALLRGLITDPHGRPVVPTFSCKGTRRYRYYETRKDIVRADKVPTTRFPMPHLDAHIIDQLRQLLGDEHALRRLSWLTDAAGLEALRKGTLNLLATSGSKQLVRILVKAIDVQTDHLLLKLDPSTLMPGNETGDWMLKLPLPKRKPLNEARLSTAVGFQASVAE